MAVMRAGTLEWSDSKAARMVDNPALLWTALYKLAAGGPQQGTGALRPYNPGLSPMFLASPFDRLQAVANVCPWPARVVAMIADAGPTTTQRAQRLENLTNPYMPEAIADPEPSDGQ
jgi:hypothetical protein